MKEEIQIEHSGGVIRLLGNEDEYALFLNNIPIQFIWLREGNTTWRYQIGKNITEADIIQDGRFREFVKQGQIGEALLEYVWICKKVGIGINL